MSKDENGEHMPLVLRGSLIVLKRKCGKPGCHCARGEPHETPALSASIDGRTQILTLRDEDLPGVEAALARYKRARANLDRDAQAGLATLRQRVGRAKAQQGTRAFKKTL
jgi:hypothetical protein